VIVNADDFGYFRCISEGIVEAVQAGSVTATGILANGEELPASVSSLLAADRAVDIGVHLNLTWGAPLTPDIARSYARGGWFPHKMTLLRELVGGRLRQRDVKVEWSAQIERCFELGLQPRFLNSHEHVHMWPRLNALAWELAETHGIPHVRHVTPEWSRSVRAVPRSLAMSVLSQASSVSSQAGRGRERLSAPRLLGLSASGRLDLRYLKRRFASVREGTIYELMCHPGRFDPEEIQDRRLIDYHRWEEELRTLTDPSFHRFCTERGIKLIGFRHLREEKQPLAVLPKRRGE
jgi:hypothetical protein